MENDVQDAVHSMVVGVRRGRRRDVFLLVRRWWVWVDAFSNEI